MNGRITGWPSPSVERKQQCYLLEEAPRHIQGSFMPLAQKLGCAWQAMKEQEFGSSEKLSDFYNPCWFMLLQGYYISISWRYHGRFNQQWCWALKMVDSLKILKVQTTTQSGPCCGSPTFNVIQRINCLFLRIASQAGKVVQFFGENPSLKRRMPPRWTTLDVVLTHLKIRIASPPGYRFVWNRVYSHMAIC